MSCRRLPEEEVSAGPEKLPNVCEGVVQGSLKNEDQSNPDVARHWLSVGRCADPCEGKDVSQRPNTSRHRGYSDDSSDDAKLYKEFL